MALLLSATLAVSPVLAVPAFATQDGDAPSPIEQNDDQTTDQGGEKDPEVEKTPDAETVDPDAEQGTGEKDGAAEKDGVPADTTDQPAAEPRSGGVAQVEETDGTITSYTSLREAVDAVNAKGGTLKLLADTSESFSITHDDVTVTAADRVTYSGTMRINAPDCKVTGVAFHNPGCSEQGVGFDNCVELHANNGTVENCTFDVPGGVWQSKDGTLHAGTYWQPNAVAVFQNTDGCTVAGCTFNLGRVNETVDGTDYEADSNVAVNVIGPGVSNLTVSGNTMTVTAPAGVQKSAGVCFIVANGNLESGGITDLTISDNTFSGSADEANAQFVGVSGCYGIKIAGSKVTGAEHGIYEVTYQGVNKPSEFTELLDNNIDANQTMVKAEVATSDGHTYEFVSLADAIASDHSDGATIQLTQNVTENVTIPDGKTVTLDLAGHTLTNAYGEHTVTVTKGATLTVTDSSADKAGVIDNVSHGKAALFNDQGGTVVLNGGTFNRSKENGSSAVQSGGNSFYTLQNYGSMTINEGVTVRQGSNEEGGKFSSLIENGWYNGKLNTSKDEATMVINGGSFVGGLNTIKNDDWGVLTINGGSFTNTAQAAVLNWNKTTIKGGEFQSDQYAVLNGKLDNSMDVGELVIEGGSFKGGNGYKVVSQMSSSTPIGSVAISGGEFWTAPDEEFIVPGSGLTQNSDGSYVIHEHIGTAVAAKDPTCTEAGNKAYWECSECHELFLDEAMTQPTTREYVTIAATGHQHVTHVEAKDATETETGNLEYWYCADCGRYFSDAALSQETTLAELTIPAKGQEPADKPKDEDVEKDDSLAQTGDATAVAPLVASAVAGVSALAAGAVTLRKRK